MVSAYHPLYRHYQNIPCTCPFQGIDQPVHPIFTDDRVNGYEILAGCNLHDRRPGESRQFFLHRFKGGSCHVHHQVTLAACP